jgi:hypothetical protein
MQASAHHRSNYLPEEGAMCKVPEKEASPEKDLNLKEDSTLIVQCSSPPCVLSELDPIFWDPDSGESLDQPAAKGARLVE